MFYRGNLLSMPKESMSYVQIQYHHRSRQFEQSFQANVLNFTTYANDSQQVKTKATESIGKHPLCTRKSDCARQQSGQWCVQGNYVQTRALDSQCQHRIYPKFACTLSDDICFLRHNIFSDKTTIYKTLLKNIHATTEGRCSVFFTMRNFKPYN